MKRILFLSIFIFSSSLFAQQGWYFLNPTPTGNPILDIKMFNETTGICITAKEVLRTTNGGANWNKVNTTWTSFNNSLSMIDSLNGYMAIDTSTILKTTNGGINWYYRANIKNSRIGKIYFISESIGFALQFESVNYYNNIFRGKILRTTNGGKNWDSVVSAKTTDMRYYNIYFPSPSTGFVTGKFYQGSNVYRSVLLKTTNNGVKWDSISNESNFDFGPLYFTDDNTGFSGGNNRLVKTTNGGMNWSYVNFAQGNSSQIQFFNPSTGFVSAGNIFAKTTNGGASWVYTYGMGIFKFDFINDNTGIGTSGAQVLITTNSGLNWINHSKSSFTHDFWEVRFSDENSGYAIPKNNKILHTTNGGLNWTEKTFGSDMMCSIANVNQNVCYVASGWNGVIYKTTNSGQTWNTLSLSAGLIFTIKFLNENTGFGVCKYGRFFKTTNGGANWFYKDSLENYESGAIDFIDENTGMIGGSRLYKTTNGGVNWKEILIGKRVNDIKFVTCDIVFTIVTSAYNGYEYPAYIMKSTDGGNKWDSTRIHCYYPKTIQFPDANTGYLQAYDKMYKTTNQGINWFEINNGVEYGLQSFDWINTLTGFSVGNEGVILKTTDGGGVPSYILSFPEYIPETYHLHQNYPNPFNPATKIKFDLPQGGTQNVKIIIFDILGRKVETLLEENFSPGEHEVSWNASGFAAGVYFYMLVTDSFKETKKMILVK